MLSPEQIEIEINKPQNRHWTPLDVIRECIGVEPTSDQVRWSKMSDRKTVEGIPTQIRIMQEDWYTAFPGLKLTAKTLGRLIKVDDYDTSHWKFDDRNTIVRAIDDPYARKYLVEETTWWPVHPVLKAFRKVVGRDPTQHAFEYYDGERNKHGWNDTELEKAIQAGMQS